MLLLLLLSMVVPLFPLPLPLLLFLCRFDPISLELAMANQMSNLMAMKMFHRMWALLMAALHFSQFQQQSSLTLARSLAQVPLNMTTSTRCVFQSNFEYSSANHTEINQNAEQIAMAYLNYLCPIFGKWPPSCFCSYTTNQPHLLSRREQFSVDKIHTKFNAMPTYNHKFSIWQTDKYIRRVWSRAHKTILWCFSHSQFFFFSFFLYLIKKPLAARMQHLFFSKREKEPKRKQRRKKTRSKKTHQRIKLKKRTSNTYDEICVKKL